MAYTRAAFARLTEPGLPVTLPEIPLDAPFRGPGPLWVWSEISTAWIGYPEYVFQQARRDRPAPAFETIVAKQGE